MPKRVKQNIEQAENHPLYSKWEEDKGAYDQMIEDYERKVAELAPQANIDNYRLQALKDGKAILIDNFPTLLGDFVQLPTKLLLIKEKGSYSGISTIIVNDDFSVGQYSGGYDEADFDGGKVITANSSEAEEIYQKMAKYDEQVVDNSYRWMNYIPQVEKYIDSSIKIKLDRNQAYELTAGGLDFNLIVRPDYYQILKGLPKAYAHIQKIYDDYGVEYREDGVYAPAVNIVELNSWANNETLSRLMHFCLRYGYPINDRLPRGQIRLDAITRLQTPQTLESVDDTFAQIDVANIESKEALIEKVNQLANQRLEQLEAIAKGLTVFDYQTLVSAYIPNFDRNIFTHLFHLALNCVKNYEQKQTEKADDEKAKEQEALRNSLLSQYLTVSGNTLRYKDRNGNKFRDSVMSAMKTNELDPAYAVGWLKKDKSFNKKGDNAFFERFNDEQMAALPANSWIIHKKAWEWLILNYAEDLYAHSISSSSII